MRLVSWNICHPRKTEGINKVFEVLEQIKPDLVALQEVAIKKSLPVFLEGLRAIGLSKACQLIPDRGWGLLVASRKDLVLAEIKGLPGSELKVTKKEIDFPRKPAFAAGECFRSRILSVRVERGGVPFELHNIHVPYGSSGGWRKIDTFRALTTRLEKRSDLPCIVCGDFNEPRSESEDGGVETWAWHNRFSKAKVAKPEVWDREVKKIFEGCSAFGLSDVMWKTHGSKVIGMASHFPRGNGKPRRYDHVFASNEFKVMDVSYLLKSNWAQVSDHVPAMIDFTLE